MDLLELIKEINKANNKKAGLSVELTKLINKTT